MLITIQINHCAYVTSATMLLSYIVTIKIDAFDSLVYKCINTHLKEDDITLFFSQLL